MRTRGSRMISRRLMGSRRTWITSLRKMAQVRRRFMAYSSQLSAASCRGDPLGRPGDPADRPYAVSFQLFDNEVNIDSILISKQEPGNEGQHFHQLPLLAFAFAFAFALT